MAISVVAVAIKGKDNMEVKTSTVTRVIRIDSKDQTTRIISRIISNQMVTVAVRIITLVGPRSRAMVLPRLPLLPLNLALRKTITSNVLRIRVNNSSTVNNGALLHLPRLNIKASVDAYSGKTEDLIVQSYFELLNIIKAIGISDMQ